MSNSLVSVITPVFNAEKYLSKFLASLHAQTYDFLEIIIINDGSTDRSQIIINDWAKRIESSTRSFISLSHENQGAAAAVLKGLKAATGRFVIWPDSDDILLPESIAKRVAYLEATGADVVISDSYLTKDSINYVPYALKFFPYPAEDRMQRVLDAIEQIFPVQPAGIMVDKRCLVNIGVLDNFYVSKQGQNFQIYLPLLYNCKWIKLNEALQVILEDPNSHSRKKRSFLKAYQRLKEINFIISKTIDNSFAISEKEKIIIKHRSNIKTRKELILLFCNFIKLGFLIRVIFKFFSIISKK